MMLRQKSGKKAAMAACFGLTFLMLLALASSIEADNRVRLNMSVEGESGPADTIWSGKQAALEISIENDVILGTMSLGFEVNGNAYLTWLSQENGYGPFGKNTGLQAVTVVPGCRMDPAEVIWDASDLRIIEQDMNGVAPDSFLLSGLAMTTGLTPGPLEHMMSLHFIAGTGLFGETRILCFDSSFIGPTGDWVFVDMIGQSLSPGFDSQPGGYCWPVKCNPCIDPIVCPTEVLSANHCEEVSANVSFSSYADPPEPFDIQLIGHNGGGAAIIHNLPQIGNIREATVTYFPVPSDIGRTINISVEGCNPWGCSDPCVISVEVTNTAPTLDIGADGITGYGLGFIKTDIAGFDADTCDGLTYSLLAGSPGKIDPETGVYTWLPYIADCGFHSVRVSVTDGNETAEATFDLEVLVCGPCVAGDANFDGDVNVGDAVAVINFIFKGAGYPQVPDLYDVNGDCAINVGDAVYLINYVFKNGEAPLTGCVY